MGIKYSSPGCVAVLRVLFNRFISAFKSFSCRFKFLAVVEEDDVDEEVTDVDEEAADVEEDDELLRRRDLRFDLRDDFFVFDDLAIFLFTIINFRCHLVPLNTVISHF
jgi:hypothetical protein